MTVPNIQHNVPDDRPEGTKRQMLTIVRKKISDLHADPANANRHPENNLRAIADSLHAFGQVEPLVVQKGTGKVIGGNGRLEVLRNSGAQEVDVVELDIDGTQATALAIALNRTAKTSEFDDETLASLLQSLPQDCQIAAGFDTNELSALIDKLTPVEAPEDFKEVDENIECEHQCPKCNYKWSGGQ